MTRQQSIWLQNPYVGGVYVVFTRPTVRDDLRSPLSFSLSLPFSADVMIVDFSQPMYFLSGISPNGDSLLDLCADGLGSVRTVSYHFRIDILVFKTYKFFFDHVATNDKMYQKLKQPISNLRTQRERDRIPTHILLSDSIINLSIFW